MANYYAQVSMQPTSGASEDVRVNGFAAGEIGSLDETYATAWADEIKTFYDTLAAGTSMRGVTQNNHLIKFYEVGGAAPNYPKFERNFNLATSPGGLDMPGEVALCVSYYAAQATTVLRARRRGRIYISGWSEAANTDGRPIAGACTQLRDAFSDYVEAFNAIGGLEACVWSRANNTTYAIDTVWVDNEWDTLRSRGGKSTVRYEWSAP